MNTRLMIAAMVMVGTMLSCSQGNRAKEVAVTDIASSEAKEKLLTQDESREETQKPMQNKSPQSPAIPPPVPADWDKRIIKDATLQLQVKDPKAMNASVKEAIKLSGAYIASETETLLSAGQIKDELTIRVPREKFDELVDRICGYGDSILQKNISSTDVTEEFVDTKARISAKEKVKDRYFDFLKQTHTVDEVLKVQEVIGDLQEDIEAATGRVNYIQHQSALSTIHLTYYQLYIPPVIPEQEVPGFFKQLVTGAAEGWQVLQTLLLIMVKIWPLWLTGIIIWLVIRKRKGSYQRSAIRSEPLR